MKFKFKASRKQGFMFIFSILLSILLTNTIPSFLMNTYNKENSETFRSGDNTIFEAEKSGQYIVYYQMNDKNENFEWELQESMVEFKETHTSKITRANFEPGSEFSVSGKGWAEAYEIELNEGNYTIQVKNLPHDLQDTLFSIRPYEKSSTLPIFITMFVTLFATAIPVLTFFSIIIYNYIKDKKRK